MTEAARTLRYRLPALLWLAVVLVVALDQWRFWQAPRLDSDITALLPTEATDPALDEAALRIGEGSARQVLVLLGAPSTAQVRRAEAAYRDALRAPGLPIEAVAEDAEWFAAARRFYAPWRDRLLTAAQRDALQERPEAVVESALAALFGPYGGPRFTDWRSDPLGLWPAWWQARAEGLGLTLGAGGAIERDGLHWMPVRLQVRGSAFRLDGLPHVDTALRTLGEAARAEVGAVRILHAGVPLHAEAAAVQAHREIRTIGLGSLAAVLLLLWLCFRSPRPILLVALSLAVGVASALSLSALVFGRVHLLTLVFGASLIGVAVDYGLHWFACRQSDAGGDARALTRRLLPGLSLALASSVLAYLTLAVAPFPGLRQMAVFSATGLTAACLTVLCWFPLLAGRGPASTRTAERIGASLGCWPRLGQGRAAPAILAGALLLAVGGLWQLTPRDDLRSLQSSPPDLLAQHTALGRILGLPSPAQFYLVRGDDAEQLLQREEALTERLRALVGDGVVGGYRAVSDWVPSQRRQAEDAALAGAAESAVFAALAAMMESPPEPSARTRRPLLPETWLADPASMPMRHLWLGGEGASPAAVVMLDGLDDPAKLTALAAQAEGLPGVTWVDRTADIGAVLRDYRGRVGWLLALAYAVVALVLSARFGRRAWRAVLPAALASTLVLAALGWLGEPLQLFNLLALLLLLGMGLDYGIFLLEHRAAAAPAWTAISLGAASTWFAFGLLALSATPALRAFGLTMLLGIALVWLLAPLFRMTGPVHGRG